MTTIATRPILRQKNLAMPATTGAELTDAEVSALHQNFPAYAGLAAAIVTSSARTWDSFAAQIKRFGGDKPAVESMRLLARMFNIGHDKSSGINLAGPAADKNDNRLADLRRAVKAALGDAGASASYQNIADLLEKKLPPRKIIESHDESAPTESSESEPSAPAAPSQPRVSAALPRAIIREARQLMNKPIVWNPADNQAVFIHRGYEIPNMHDLRAMLDKSKDGLTAHAVAYAMLVAEKQDDLPLAYSHVCLAIVSEVLAKPSLKITESLITQFSAELALEGRRVVHGHGRAKLAKTAILLLHSLHDEHNKDPLAELLQPGETVTRDVTIGEMQAALRGLVYNGLVSTMRDGGPRNEITYAKYEDFLPTGLVDSLIALSLLSNDEHARRDQVQAAPKRHLRSVLMLHQDVLQLENLSLFWQEVGELSQMQFAAIKDEAAAARCRVSNPVSSSRGESPIDLVRRAGIGLRGLTRV